MIKRFFYRIFCGFFLGVSVFAPGFSGSVIAIILGIYQDLLRIASNPFKRLKENIYFCLPLVIGAGISAVMFVLFFKFMFEHYEKATYLLFVGLIAGNFPVILKEIRKFAFKKRYLFGGGGAFALALALGILSIGMGHGGDANALYSGVGLLALSGLAVGVTALIPGMSVSMVLIIMGVYSQLIFAAESLLRLDFTYAIPFGIFCICAVLGLVLTSRGIKHLFEKFPGFSNTTVLGFMGGSLIGILIESFHLSDANFGWLLGGVMLAVGFGISMLFVFLGKTLGKG